jgi:hypothetical protein
MHPNPGQVTHLHAPTSLAAYITDAMVSSPHLHKEITNLLIR